MDVENPRVRLEAIKAATSFIVANGTENHLTAMFKELVPAYMSAVNDILHADIDGEDEVRNLSEQGQSLFHNWLSG